MTAPSPAPKDLDLQAGPGFSPVQPEYIAQLLDSAPTQEHVFWGKCLIVAWRLPNGFVVCGRGECQDPEQFDIEVGRAAAREDAEAKLWECEVYLKRSVADTMA